LQKFKAQYSKEVNNGTNKQKKETFISEGYFKNNRAT